MKAVYVNIQDTLSCKTDSHYHDSSRQSEPHLGYSLHQQILLLAQFLWDLFFVLAIRCDSAELPDPACRVVAKFEIDYLETNILSYFDFGCKTSGAKSVIFRYRTSYFIQFCVSKLRIY